MLVNSFIAIGIGATLGAWLRWALGLFLNPVLSELPLGTLTANLVGGYLVGLAVEFFIHQPALSPEWRLFIITGFLGGLTTFSTFSAETVMLLMRGQYVWCIGIVAAHLGGSLLMTILGIQTLRWIQ
jgi:CrcB protein